MCDRKPSDPKDDRKFRKKQQAKGDKDAQKELRQRSRVILQEAVEGRLMRAIYGPRQLQEVMTAFWFNHFNVFAGKGLCRLWVGAYEQEAIRPHTMGRFRTLLVPRKRCGPRPAAVPSRCDSPSWAGSAVARGLMR
jgi:uncharacterized protein (DUF1800 family)